MSQETIVKEIEFIDRYGRRASVPKVGDGATYGAGSDSYPATVTHVEVVRNVVFVTIQGDDYRCRDDDGNYIGDTFTRNTRERKQIYRLDPWPFEKSEIRHYWQQVYRNESTGRWNKTSSRGGVGFGFRKYHIDPHF